MHSFLTEGGRRREQGRRRVSRWRGASDSDGLIKMGRAVFRRGVRDDPVWVQMQVTSGDTAVRHMKCGSETHTHKKRMF